MGLSMLEYIQRFGGPAHARFDSLLSLFVCPMRAWDRRYPASETGLFLTESRRAKPLDTCRCFCIG